MTDKLLYRILSGKTNITVKNKLFIIKPISIEHKFIVEEYYENLLQEYGQLDNLLTQGQLYSWMFKNGLWSEEENKKIDKYKQDMEDLKVKIFECGYRTREKQVVKEALKIAKGNLENLLIKKHAFDFLTPEGAAGISKNKYLIALSIYKNKKRLFTPKSYFNSNFPYLDNIIIEYNRQSINTEQIRYIARSDTWRKYWCVKDADAIFGKRAIELSDEQISLISWTRLYDNIYQHPDCPEDFIVEDDDALDGFLISDKRKRDKDKGYRQVDSMLTNEKIRNADEVFVVADTREDAKKIQDLNDVSSRAAIRNREKLIEKKGIVLEGDLPDVKLKQKMEINRKAAQLIKGQ